MSDYFGEYPPFAGARGLPSPADTPYETPGFIRSKRSSRATAGSSREQSVSPPPLPPEPVGYQRDGGFSGVDPRRFTPTLHASLVSEILNLRRELDLKNTLVENLEITLSTTKNENETLGEQLSQHARDVRKANQQVEQMEKGALEAVEDMVKERDIAVHNAEELKNKLESANKRMRSQDEDASRTQGIWENEKESWENERRQLERRVHVTESRLRMFVDEMSAQQAAAEVHHPHSEEMGGGSAFKDSGLGHESDTASVRSEVTPRKHRRNMSSISQRTRSVRYSASTRSTADTPEPHARSNGYSLADELDIDEEDDYDLDEFMHPEGESDYPGLSRQALESRQSMVSGDADAKAKRVLGIDRDTPDTPKAWESAKTSTDAASADVVCRPSNVESSFPSQSVERPAPVRHVEYVHTGYQPSPPQSPHRTADSTARTTSLPQILEPAQDPATSSAAGGQRGMKHALEVATRVAASPISPPETPVMDGVTWPESKRMSIPAPAYSDMSTQTESVETARPKSHASNRDSLSPPMFVPSIAIHPPSSRPSSPRPYVLPPGTKNASTQASLAWPGRDACMQTEEIRVDRRLRKLPSHLLPSALLPSPSFPEAPKPRAASGGTAKIFTDVPMARAFPSPPLQSPTASSPETLRERDPKDARSLPLRAIPLPRPILAPQSAQSAEGPLNRSSQYGVTRPLQTSSQLLDIEQDPELSESDYEDQISDGELADLNGSIPAFSRAPHGRFGLSGPPKVVPEDKELSPDRRPDTADSYGAAPAPSVASSRAPSQQRNHARPPAKLNAYKDLRSRSPSFGSVISSSGLSAQSAIPPPYPIPTRSSSRVKPSAQSEGSQSPTPYNGSDQRSYGGYRPSRTQHHARQNSLRKVQSAAVIRHSTRVKTSPQKGRRRQRSPGLTPIQSMAFDNPAPTRFPMPDLSSSKRDSSHFDLVKGSVDLSNMSTGGATTIDRSSQEANLVDAIAATMVGEWMWKYVRKRKSFGIGEDTTDFPQHGQNGATNSTNHGTRHKRWVWLSPYERTIMWDSKQPTNGTALLGKKGRKLVIQSAVEVQDVTPMPKDAGAIAPIHRSILILTPARALKFTATSLERHGLWMTALQFLSQPEGIPTQGPADPTPPRIPIPGLEALPASGTRSPSFGRATIRDSVGLTKGRRPSLYQSQSQPMTNTTGGMDNPDYPVQDDGADFPAVPRLYSSTTRHQRKRSNTSPRLPQPLSNLRSISSSAIPSSASSKLHPGSTNGSSIRTDLRSSSSKSGSRRESITSPDRPNFFEAVGTVRMDAFVDPNVRNGVLYVPAPPPSVPVPGSRRRRGDSNLSTSTIDKRRAGYVFDENGMDPFKGF